MEITTGKKTKECIFCAEVIQAKAVKCRFCNEFLNTAKAKMIEAQLNGEEKTDQADEDDILFEGSPSLWAMTGTIVRWGLVIAAGVALIKYRVEGLYAFSDNTAALIERYRGMAGWLIATAGVLVLLYRAAALKMKYYEVTADRIEYSKGIFDRSVDNLDMFRVIDLKLRRSLLDCVVGIGTVTLTTNDKSDPEFDFEKIRDPLELYDIIKQASLNADQRRSVLHLE